MTNREQREALSSQSACDCPARPGQLHSGDCQYVTDLVADQNRRIVEAAERITRTAR
jgi:hypothetical protein